MARDVIELARLYKMNIFRSIPDDYKIDDEYISCISDNEAKEGILAFKSFLNTFFDYVVENANSMETVVKENKKGELPTSFIVRYAFLRDVMYSFFFIGVVGDLTNSISPCLSVDGKKLTELFKITRMKRIYECILCLSDIGFYFENIDITAKSFKLSNVNDFKVFYPDNPSMLIGLKLMAEANQKVYGSGASRPLDRIFLRCNYHALENTLGKEPVLRLNESIGNLTPETQSVLLEIDKQLISNGYKCESHVGNLYTFIYTNKKTKRNLITIYVMGDHCHIKMTPDNMLKYPDFIKSMPDEIVSQLISSGDCEKMLRHVSCSKCTGGVEFEIDGIHYMKCKRWNFNNLLLERHESRETIKKWMALEIENSK